MVTTDGRTYSGLVVPGAGKEWIVLQSDGKKVAVPQDQVEAMQAELRGGRAQHRGSEDINKRKSWTKNVQYKK